jgi:hypothetical protein
MPDVALVHQSVVPRSTDQRNDQRRSVWSPKAHRAQSKEHHDWSHDGESWRVAEVVAMTSIHHELAQDLQRLSVELFDERVDAEHMPGRLRTLAAQLTRLADDLDHAAPTKEMS